jgi:hypothetical protein
MSPGELALDGHEQHLCVVPGTRERQPVWHLKHNVDTLPFQPSTKPAAVFVIRE